MEEERSTEYYRFFNMCMVRKGGVEMRLLNCLVVLPGAIFEWVKRLGLNNMIPQNAPGTLGAKDTWRMIKALESDCFKLPCTNV